LATRLILIQKSLGSSPSGTTKKALQKCGAFFILCYFEVDFKISANLVDTVFGTLHR
jgi:hypothetical protein